MCRFPVTVINSRLLNCFCFRRPDQISPFSFDRDLLPAIVGCADCNLPRLAPFRRPGLVRDFSLDLAALLSSPGGSGRRSSPSSRLAESNRCAPSPLPGPSLLRNDRVDEASSSPIVRPGSRSSFAAGMGVESMVFSSTCGLIPPRPLSG